MRSRHLIVGVLLAVCFPAARVMACYAVIVGRKASADGSVLVGHNEQNGGERILNFRRIPRRQFPAGSVVRLRRGGTLPQVAETWAFLWSENPGLEFSDGYLNEWGVAVVSDGCPTREDDYETLVALGEIRNGGVGYLLRRLVAERARSAREGVELAGSLVELLGYVDSGRTYVIADPREAWLFAVVRGRRWVARRVPDDVVVLLPNVHVIGEVDLEDTDHFLASPDLVDYAVRRGWFDPSGGEPFSFRRVYCGEAGRRADPRRLRGRQLVSGRREQEPSEGPLSFGIRPARKMTVAAVIEVLRDKAGARPLSTPATQEGAVFQLRAHLPKEVGCIYWRTTAEPSTSVLVPWYLGITQTPGCYSVGSIDEDRSPVARGATTSRAPAHEGASGIDAETYLSLEHHFQPPEGTFQPDPALAWWTFKRLQDLVYEDYEVRVRSVRPVWKTFEEHAFGRQRSVEEEALRIWKTDPQAARRFLTQYSARLAAQACQEAEKLTASLSEQGAEAP